MEECDWLVFHIYVYIDMYIYSLKDNWEMIRFEKKIKIFLNNSKNQKIWMELDGFLEFNLNCWSRKLVNKV